MSETKAKELTSLRKQSPYTIIIIFLIINSTICSTGIISILSISTRLKTIAKTAANTTHNHHINTPIRLLQTFCPLINPWTQKHVSKDSNSAYHVHHTKEPIEPALRGPLTNNTKLHRY